MKKNIAIIGWFTLLLLSLMFGGISQSTARSKTSSGNPIDLCAEGVKLFLEGEYAKALPLLEAGYNDRKKVTFNNPDDLGMCALTLGFIRVNNLDTTGGMEAYMVALDIFTNTNNHEFRATTLSNIGYIYNYQSRYNEALDYYQQALDIQHANNYKTGEIITLTNIGQLYGFQGYYSKALDYLQQALAMSLEANDKEREGAAQNNIGQVYSDQSRYKDALDSFQRALEISRDMGYRSREGITLDNIGLVYINQSRYSEALEIFQQALAIQREIGDQIGEGASLHNIGSVYNYQGRYREALDTFQKALLIRRKISDRKGEGATLNNIGLAYQCQGRYREALDSFQQALSVEREMGDRAAEGSTLSNIGNVFDSQSRYSEATDYYREALAIQQEIGDRIHEANTLNNIGLDLYAQNLYSEAVDRIQQALMIHREIGDRKGEGTALNNLASVYDSQGQYSEALEFYEQALVIAREVGDQFGEGYALHNIGYMYASQGLNNDALDYWQQALTLRIAIGDRAGEAATLRNIGQYYRDQGMDEQALDYWLRALECIEDIRAKAGSEVGRSSFIAQYSDLYSNVVTLYNQINQPEQAFFTSERGRARGFLDSLATGYVELSDNTISDSLANEIETYAVLLSTQKALANAKADPSSEPDLVADLEKQLANAEQAHTDALDAITNRGGQLAALIPGRSSVLTLEQVQALLPDNTTLVSYFVLGDKGTLAFIISNQNFATVELHDATPNNLSQAVNDLYSWPSHNDAFPPPLRNLYIWLVAPIVDYLNTPVVGIIPHQMLHYVPFTALTDGQNYFGEQYVLFELPSASTLPFIQQNASQTPGSGALVFGNPTSNVEGLSVLMYANAESESVATLLNTSSYTGTNANESRLKASVGGISVLHLAAHGEYNPSNPLYSTIYLAPGLDGKDDGRLEVHEIYGLNLKGSKLVVLSACKSQMGQLSSGDELIGLTRAFMFAGTPSVIASLWNVDDEATQTLMVSFYHHWLQDGMGKGQALQTAQADVRANPMWKSPYFWSGYVLSGEATQVTVISNSSLKTTPTQSSIPKSTLTMAFYGSLLLMMCFALFVFALLILFFATRNRSNKNVISSRNHKNIVG